MFRRPSIMLVKEQSNDSWSDPSCQIQKESRGGQDNTVEHRRVEYSSMASLDSFGISGRANETSVRFLLNRMPTKQRFESFDSGSIRPRGSSGYKVDIIYGPFGSIIHRLVNDGDSSPWQHGLFVSGSGSRQSHMHFAGSTSYQQDGMLPYLIGSNYMLDSYQRGSTFVDDSSDSIERCYVTSFINSAVVVSTGGSSYNKDIIADVFRRGLNGRDRATVVSKDHIVSIRISSDKSNVVRLVVAIRPGGSSDNERSSSREGAYMMVYVNDASCTVVEEQPTIGPHYVVMFQREHSSRPFDLEHHIKTVVSSITFPTHPPFSYQLSYHDHSLQVSLPVIHDDFITCRITAKGFWVIREGEVDVEYVVVVAIELVYPMADSGDIEIVDSMSEIVTNKIESMSGLTYLIASSMPIVDSELLYLAVDIADIEIGYSMVEIVAFEITYSLAVLVSNNVKDLLTALEVALVLMISGVSTYSLLLYSLTTVVVDKVSYLIGSSSLLVLVDNFFSMIELSPEYVWIRESTEQHTVKRALMLDQEGSEEKLKSSTSQRRCLHIYISFKRRCCLCSFTFKKLKSSSIIHLREDVNTFTFPS